MSCAVKKLLVGYGNTTRRDDGVGWLIADQLAPHYADTGVEVIQTQQLMPEIALSISTVDCVVFVDAAIGVSPGAVAVNALTATDNAGNTHALGPAEILYIAKKLYNATPQAHLVTITGLDFDFGEGVSPTVAAAMPQALALIKQLLAQQ